MSKSENYKTRLCKNWENTGECEFGEKCHYAHGSEDLRTRSENKNMFLTCRDLLILLGTNDKFYFDFMEASSLNNKFSKIKKRLDKLEKHYESDESDEDGNESDESDEDDLDGGDESDEDESDIDEHVILHEKIDALAEMINQMNK